MRELDYRPNAVARNLRRSRTSLWAVIISDISNPFFTALVRGVEDVAQNAAYSVVLCNSDNDEAKEGQYVAAALTEQVAGVIISPTPGSPHLARLLDARVPVVVIDRQAPGHAVDTVLVDNEQGAHQAVAHLAAAGYRRIACIIGPAGLFTAERRLAGYRRALADAGLPDAPGLVRQTRSDADGGHAAMDSLLATGERPDAVFVGNNLMTIGAVTRLYAEGLAVPDEMGVVGFDDVPWATLMRPALTTVAQPTYEVGRSAAELLTARVADPKRDPTTVTLPTELLIRESSGHKP
jgi:LacI family transcriptional regulator